MISRRNFLVGTAGLASVAALRPVVSQTKKLRFGVGPLLPNPEDTKKAYTPVFAHLAKKIGVDFDLVATTDWAGMAVAMGSGQLDVAWMGPWGYIIANNATGCQAVATAKYDDKPIYFAIIIARPDLPAAKFPDDTKGRSIAFADVGSTSGWLIPSYYAKEVWKIDPKTYWKYSEGATHAANEIAVGAGQVDMATDFDRNRNAMIASGRVKADSNKIIWTSDPLPNDAITMA
ncbi:MAG: phosphate/phosphite/phosphonate ABC transporter substrate-binding protein, partial [Burkholderiales bacterium]